MLEQELPRVVIENVSPSIDGGRYPVKCVIFEDVRIEADIYKDGHDLIAARVLYRAPGERSFREAPLEYHFNPDRWSGSFRADRLGRWAFTIEAWPDHYGTWRRDLRKRLDAGQDVRPELLEGAALLEKAAKRLEGSAKERVRRAASLLASTSAHLEERLNTAFADDIAQAVYGPLEPPDATRYAPELSVVVDREAASFAAWYELFPRSQAEVPGQHGTFKDAERRLPDIAALGFDVVYLPPIHPIGKVNRKGRNNTKVAAPTDVGSPWAIGSDEGGHCAVHPQLGTLEDFRAFVKSANEFGIEVALDYALQCAPDHPWAKEHPDWFNVRPDGSIRYAENPPKKYEDIYPLNFWCEDRQALWNACRDVLLFWIEQGVKTFRVDNPHTKPLAFWEWVIAEVQREHPDTVFLAEAFTRPKRMKGLAKLGFTQSYTYFTWKNSKQELTEYLTELTQTGMAAYYRPNFFTNTPDILHEYLQTGGRPAFRVRLLLAGTLAPVFGIYSGYELCENTPLRPGSEEYLNSEKYEIRVRDWNAPGNIKQDVAKLNRIRRENPALHSLTNLQFLDTLSEHIIAYSKHAPGNDLIVVCNLDPFNAHETEVHVPPSLIGAGAEGEPFEVIDLLTGATYRWKTGNNYVKLDPAYQVGHLLRVQRPQAFV